MKTSKRLEAYKKKCSSLLTEMNRSYKKWNKIVDDGLEMIREDGIEIENGEDILDPGDDSYFCKACADLGDLILRIEYAIKDAKQDEK